MTEKKFCIMKCHLTDKCFYCDTEIEKGEDCLILRETSKNYSGVWTNFYHLRIHLTCIEPFIKELRKDVKKFIISQLR
jgi:hypothetical protein